MFLLFSRYSLLSPLNSLNRVEKLKTKNKESHAGENCEGELSINKDLGDDIIHDDECEHLDHCPADTPADVLL